MATTLVPLYRAVESVTNAQETTLAGTLSGQPEYSSIVFNSDTSTIRYWNGTAFADMPTVSPLQLGTGASISTKYLRGDGTWQTIAGGGDMLAANNLSDVANTTTARNNILPSKTGNTLKVLRVNAGETDYELATIAALSDGDKGDITVSASGATWTIDNEAVTNGKILSVAESKVTFTDITTGNVSASNHGFAPKLSNSNTTFLDGTGAYSAPKLSYASAFATGTTSISAATYADITGCSVSLAAGTWVIFAHVVCAAANLIIQCFGAITHSDNTVIAESAISRPASGTASLQSPISMTWTAVVTPASTTTYKLRAARGLTTHTSTYTVVDGTGYNTANHASNNSNKGTSIIAIRIA